MGLLWTEKGLVFFGFIVLLAHYIFTTPKQVLHDSNRIMQHREAGPGAPVAQLVNTRYLYDSVEGESEPEKLK
jgi:hypothetical protein